MCHFLAYTSSTATSVKGNITGVIKKEMNRAVMHIKSATWEGTVKNMGKCADNTGYYEWPCVKKTLRIMQYLSSKRVNRLSGFVNTRKYFGFVRTRKY